MKRFMAGVFCVRNGGKRVDRPTDLELTSREMVRKARRVLCELVKPEQRVPHAKHAKHTKF